MSRNDLLRQIESFLNLEAGTLAGPEPLEQFDDWDSLAILSVISLFDKDLGIVLPPIKIQGCKDFDDIVALAGDKVTV